MDTWCNSLNQIAIVYFHTFICHFENKYLTHEIKKKKKNIITQKIKIHRTVEECTKLEELIKN